MPACATASRPSAITSTLLRPLRVGSISRLEPTPIHPTSAPSGPRLAQLLSVLLALAAGHLRYRTIEPVSGHLRIHGASSRYALLCTRHVRVVTSFAPPRCVRLRESLLQSTLASARLVQRRLPHVQPDRCFASLP
ncbi:hypothetical protein ZWY2020_047354 [Hordeum vulgare]|nr:hypothetical protein ZWY2020_047354 [Hordeum vulgare]